MADFPDARRRWNERYLQQDGFLFGIEPNAWVEAHQAYLQPGARVLSVADGEGRNAVFAAHRGAQVTAFDIADAAVSRARQLATDLGCDVDFHRCDLQSWSWEAQAYDVVLAIFVQFAGPELRDSLFAHVRQTLKPGGVFIIEGYGPRQMGYQSGGPGVLENLYTLPLLKSALPEFTCLHERDEDVVLSEGQGHRGLAHLVSAVLRK